MPNATYAEQIRKEAAIWGAAASEVAARIPPDWVHHRRLPANLVRHTRDIDELLARIRPGMRVLEIGCSSGWLTVAMARQGALVHGVDVAEPALAIARDYYQAHRNHLAGVATYEAADVNDLNLSGRQYDAVVAKGIMHHLPQAASLIERLHAALEPGALLWASDTHGDESTTTALIAGAVTFVLPTHVSYADKLRGLARFGTAAPERIKASMETRGFSPFEGAGRAADWPAAIRRLFDVEFERAHPALAGYIAAELRAPDLLARPFVGLLAAVDRALVAAGLLHSTGLTISARKRARET
jgi:2-polyprenyl-3-methyl-5-hydroxy-6-metoxy-1,4-benzoquinol methylase